MSLAFVPLEPIPLVGRSTANDSPSIAIYSLSYSCVSIRSFVRPSCFIVHLGFHSLHLDSPFLLTSRTLHFLFRTSKHYSIITHTQLSRIAYITNINSYTTLHE